MYITVITKDETKIREYSAPIRLSQALRDMNIPCDLPCGGKGTCGKCKAKAAGDLSDFSPEERRFLTKEEQSSGVRLVCRAVAIGDVTIDYTEKFHALQGVTDGKSRNVERIPVTGEERCTALAFDIGTTTVAGYAYQFPEGELIHSLCEQNDQCAFGADVVSRLSYAQEGGRTELERSITEQIERMGRALLGDQIPRARVITGNTTMLHFYCGMDTSGIAVAPFRPESLFGDWRGSTYFPACMDAYVGADITTAVVSSGMTEHATAFLVDIGTNGEMALWHQGELFCCSTAAGPALEGVGISMGMMAKPGAISTVWLEDGDVCYDTINHLPAVGICGTGLIDAVYCMRQLGIVDETGYLDQPFPIGDSGVTITPQDIRQTQLAKAAISAGIRTLLTQGDVTVDDLSAFYIAGGFGSYIRPESAAGIGLIPKEAVKKAVILGNAAGIGAGLLLKNRELLAQSEQLAKQARPISLAESPVFMECYMEEMMFP